MAASTPATSVPGMADLPKRKSQTWAFIKGQPLGFMGLLIILLYVVLAFGAKWISPFDPEAVDFGAMTAAPSLEHLFGTDQYGRDVFSRLVYGARTALAVGILSSLVGCSIGA
ncbi:MAG: ABC transporter permease, partial [Hyphomicrobiaceae bacterium]|nr:ABC transporter permease [Hyphomicrobiaceae bacterium]